MSALLTEKVVAALPGVLTPSTIYFVRVGTGFDIYVTTDQGQVVAYPLNKTRVVAATINVPYTNKSDSFEIDIADALLLATDKVVVSHGNYLETDENSVDFLDGLTFGCRVADGVLTVIGVANSAVSGPIKVLYQVN